MQNTKSCHDDQPFNCNPLKQRYTMLHLRGVTKPSPLSGLMLSTCILASPFAMAEPSVNGTTISWPDDGWYQVQTVDGVTTICEGGRYCNVEPGTYLVINHATGERYTDVEVSEGDPVVDTALINRDNHETLLRQVFTVYTGHIYGDTLPGEDNEFRESHSSIEVDVPQDIADQYEYSALVQFACDNDGAMNYLSSSGYGYSLQEFAWDNCLDGDVKRQGTTQSHDNGGYGGYYRHPMSSSSYSADYADGRRVEVSGQYGSIVESMIDPAIHRTRHWMSENFDYILQQESGELKISDANTNVKQLWINRSPHQFLAALEGSFQLSSTLTENHSIEVETSETLAGEYLGVIPINSSPLGYYPDWTFTHGVLEMRADDGSAMRLEADNGDPRTAQITLLQDGFVLETFQQPWLTWWDTLNRLKDDPRDTARN